MQFKYSVRKKNCAESLGVGVTSASAREVSRLCREGDIQDGARAFKAKTCV